MKKISLAFLMVFSLFFNYSYAGCPEDCTKKQNYQEGDRVLIDLKGGYIAGIIVGSTDSKYKFRTNEIKKVKFIGNQFYNNTNVEGRRFSLGDVTYVPKFWVTSCTYQGC